MSELAGLFCKWSGAAHRSRAFAPSGDGRSRVDYCRLYCQGLEGVVPVLEDPIFAGWYAGEDPWSTVYGPPLRLASDARAYQVSPAWLGSVAAAQAMDLLDQIGTQAIYAHNLELAHAFCEGMGIPPQNSAIVSIPTDVTPEILVQDGIVAAFRDGKLRLSFHLYNDFNDLEAVLHALASSRR